MPVQLIRNVRQRQPLKAAKIDYSNPISKKIVFAFEAGAGQRDLVTGVAGESIGSGVSPSAGKFGRNFDFSGSQANRSCSFGVHLGLMGATEATWDIMIYFDAGNASAHFFGQWDHNQKWLLQNNGGTLVWVPAQDDSLGRRRFDSSAPVFGSAGWYRVILSWSGGSSAVMMINRSVVGATQVNSNGVVIGPANTADYLQIGMTSGGSPLAGNVLFARAWRRGLSLSEMFSLNDNPWKIFEPETIPLFYSTVTAQTLTQSSSYSNTNTFYTHTLAATVSLAQSARFDNSNGISYTHTVTPGVRALTQSSRFDNANTLNYTHTLTPGVRALTQSARFDNANSLAYTHALAASVTLAQSSRYDNTNSIAYTHSLSATITLSQSSRFDNSNSLSYTHSISQVGGAQSLTQSARHDNGSTFYTHSLAAGAVWLTQSSRFDNTNGLAYAHALAASISLPQGARFDNANGLSYAHTLSASITLAQSARFDNSNGLAYQHSISQAGGTQSLAQSARYDNTNGLTYQHTVSAGTVTLAQSQRFDNAAQFFAHTVVQVADQFIFPAYYENANGFYQHLIGDGSVEIASGGAFHPPRIDDPRKRRRRDDETLLVIGAI